jgi:hypothetical protein
MKIYKVAVVANVPCKVCGKETKMTGTKLCDRCWEIISAIKNNVESQSWAYKLYPELVQLIKRKFSNELI